MIKQKLYIRILLLGSLFVGGSFITNNAYGIECVGPDGCPNQIKKIHRFARHGSPDAQLLLAALYEDGNLIVRNDKKAFRWYRKASKNVKGISVAYFKVGVYYLLGKGTAKNVEKGLKNLSKAARHHHINSQLMLGSIYFDGDIVERDFAKSRYWFEQAAKRHDVKAAYALAQMNEYGIGGAKNIEQAKKWYLIAAVKGYKKAEQKIAQLNPSETEKQTIKKLVKIASLEDKNKGNIMTVYGNKMDEIQMMDLVLENISETSFYNSPGAGSHIPGHNCLDNRLNCAYITDDIMITRFMGLGSGRGVNGLGQLQ